MATPVQPQRQSPAPTPRPAPQRMGFDITRPFRYTASAVKGVVTGFLDGMATLGRKGFWAGAGIGIVATIATGGAAGIGYILTFAVGGLVAGAGLGAAVGAVKGGVGNVGVSYRREKYADEMAERQTARASRESRSPMYQGSPRDRLGTRQSAANYNFERAMQQERENDREFGTYWQDRVENSYNGNGRGF